MNSCYCHQTYAIGYVPTCLSSSRKLHSTWAWIQVSHCGSVRSQRFFRRWQRRQEVLARAVLEDEGIFGWMERGKRGGRCLPSLIWTSPHSLSRRGRDMGFAMHDWCGGAVVPCGLIRCQSETLKFPVMEMNMKVLDFDETLGADTVRYILFYSEEKLEN